jgi:hypothetical protein
LNTIKSSNRGIGFEEIDTVDLCKASHNKARFILIDATISFAFDVKDPLGAYDVLIM